MEFKSENTKSLGELFNAFIAFYASFRYDRHAVSIREGGLVSRSEIVRGSLFPADWTLICCEEPFTRTNTTRNVHDHFKLSMIIQTMRGAANQLRTSPTVEVLLPVQVYLPALS